MMNHILAGALVGGLVLLAGGPASAAPRAYTLPEGTTQLKLAKGHEGEAGLAAAQGNCLTCHSSDYIAMQPPGKGKAFWESEVTKMIRVYSAPIAEPDAKAIAAYLAETY